MIYVCNAYIYLFHCHVTACKETNKTKIYSKSNAHPTKNILCFGLKYKRHRQ